MQFTAYLVAHAYTDPTGRMLPQVHAVRIYSESATSLSAVLENTAALDVYRVQGASYQEASDRLKKIVKEERFFAWCRPFMKDGDR